MDNGRKPALVFIHMQFGITDERGTVAFLGHAKATRESGIIARQQALLKAFRAKKLPVIFVNAVTDPKTKVPRTGNSGLASRRREQIFPVPRT